MALSLTGYQIIEAVRLELLPEAGELSSLFLLSSLLLDEARRGGGQSWGGQSWGGQS